MATPEAPVTEPEVLVKGLSDPVFRTVRRGYDPGEVRAYVDRVADVVHDLESRLGQEAADPQEARRGRDVALVGASPDPYDGVSAHVADLLRGFDHDVERLRVKADTDAERIRTEARVQGQMELVKARLEADRIRTEVLALRSSKMSELRTVRDHLVSSLKDLDTTLEAAPSEDHVVVLGEAGDRSPTGVEPGGAEEASAGAETRPSPAA